MVATSDAMVSVERAITPTTGIVVVTPATGAVRFTRIDVRQGIVELAGLPSLIAGILGLAE
jgi:hypothetical protein